MSESDKTRNHIHSKHIINDIRNIYEIENKIDMNLNNFMICYPENNYVRCEKPIWIAIYKMIYYEKYHEGRWTYTEYGWKPVDNFCRTEKIERSYTIIEKKDLITREDINVRSIRRGIYHKDEWGYDDIRWENRDRDISTGYEEVEGDLEIFYHERPFRIIIEVREVSETYGYDPTEERWEEELISIPVPCSIFKKLINGKISDFEKYVKNNIDYIINKIVEVLRSSPLYEEIEHEVYDKVVRRGDPEYEKTIRKIAMIELINNIKNLCNSKEIDEILSKKLEEIFQ